MPSPTPAWGRFLAELKRRKVFRSVALYGTGVFALLQIADVILPALGLPESAVTWLVVICLGGFPLALCVAWTFDLTRHGWHRTEVAGSGELDAILALPRSQRWPVGAAGVLGVVLLTLGAWWSGARGIAVPPAPAAAIAAPAASVAVLPFRNMGDPADEAFSDGLAEELGNALARLEGVHVVARTSAFAFKGRDVDAREIGETLGVGSIVEGSVRRSGSNVRISAELSRTSDGFRVWSQSWERTLTAANVFAIQEEITADVARALSREVSRVAPAELAVRETTDLEAYDLYLRGQQRWATRNPDALRAAIRNYEQAIARDSGYALAWAGLAKAWRVLPFYDRSVTGTEAYSFAVEAADRALALAPDLGDANAVRGIIASEYELDFVTARRLLTRAIAIRPSDADAHAWLCETLTVGGRDAAALPACRKAVELSPLGSSPNLLLSLALAGLGRTAESLLQADRAISLEPDIAFAQFMRASLLLRMGKRDEAAQSLEQLARIEGAADPASLRALATTYPGDVPSRRAAEAVRALERHTGTGLYFIAALYAWAGARAEAVRVIESAVATRKPWVGLAAVSPAYDGLRTSPRFAEILHELGLPNGNSAYRNRTGPLSEHLGR